MFSRSRFLGRKTTGDDASTYTGEEVAPSGFRWVFVTDDTDGSLITDDVTGDPIVDLVAN